MICLILGRVQIFQNISQKFRCLLHRPWYSSSICRGIAIFYCYRSAGLVKLRLHPCSPLAIYSTSEYRPRRYFHCTSIWTNNMSGGCRSRSLIKFWSTWSHCKFIIYAICLYACFLRMPDWRIGLKMTVEEGEVLPPGAKNSKATVEVVRGGK